MTARGYFKDGKLKVFAEFLEPLKQFAERNEGRQIILNYEVLPHDGTIGDKLEKTEMYYKLTVIPHIREILIKDGIKLKIEEVEVAMRIKFAYKHSTSISGGTTLLFAPMFQDMDLVSRLNYLSEIGMWLAKTYRLQLPKIRI